MKLEEIIKEIKPLDEAAMRSARARQDTLTKPRGQSGKAGGTVDSTGGDESRSISFVERKAVIVMAADHGVAQWKV